MADTIVKLVLQGDATGAKAALDGLKSHMSGFAKGAMSILGTVSVMGITKGILDLGKSWDQAKADFTMATGKMGDELDTYLSLIRELHSSTDMSLGEAEKTVEVLTTKLGLTTDEVKAQMLVWESFLDVFEATPETINNMETALQQYGDTSWATKENMMDMATVLKNETNMGMEDLLSNLTAIAPQMNALGMNVQQATGFIGTLAKAGFDASELTMGLNTALQKLESPEELYTIMQAIKDAPTDFEAAGLATEIFGARGGAKMATALRSGQVSIEDMTGALMDNKTAFEDAAAANEKTFQEKLGPLVNKLQEVGITMGTYLLDGLKTLIDWFTDSPTWCQIMIGSILAVGAAIALAMSANPVTLILVAITGLITIVGVIKENWETIKQFFIDIGISLRKTWDEVWTSISTWASNAWNEVVGIWNGAIKFFTDLWDNIKGIFWSAWKWILDNVVNPFRDFFTGASAVPGPLSPWTNPGTTPAPAINPNAGWHQRGGSVSSGFPYYVGERGPELFVPSGSGTVLPNDITSLLKELIRVSGGRSNRNDQTITVKVEAGAGSLLDIAARGVRLQNG